MSDEIFFPRLKRRPEVEYHSNRNDFYADYGANYKKVAEDCKHRCAYCDITVEEFGGDEMQLDHFRPQKYFNELTRHPHNLYLSCPKCNGLKTDDWPAAKVVGMPPFIGRIGYFDRFCEDPAAYVKVRDDGHIVSISGPVDYMIKKLHLNRVSRINVRRKRQLNMRKTRLLEGIRNLLLRLNDDEKSGTITKEQAYDKRSKISAMVLAYADLSRIADQS